MTTVHERIITLLVQHATPHALFNHDPSRTSVESAVRRGDSTENGAKALVIKLQDRFVLFVMRANRRLDFDKLSALTGTKPKKIRFASADELMTQTGLVSGTVPPFGRPVLDLDLFIDQSIATGHEQIGFNAGLLTASIRMQKDDYLRVANGQLADFTSPTS